MLSSRCIEPIRERDLDQLHHLQPPGWRKIEPQFAYYLRKPYCIPVKLVNKNEILGIGAGIHFGKTGWLGHIIVKPGARRRGIGSTIVTELMGRLNELGCETVSLIATAAGAPLYTRLGFGEDTDYLFFERKETAHIALETSNNIVRYHESRRDELLKLDRALSGEHRELLLSDALATSFLYVNSGHVTGFYLPGLGEGLIVAEESEAGIELMKVKHRTKYRAVVPAENQDAIDFLIGIKYIETNRAKRMIWGKPLAWQPRGLYGRIGGNVG